METFTLKMEGITPQFRCQAAAADGLVEDVNLGSGFLQRILTLGMVQLQFCPKRGESTGGERSRAIEGEGSYRKGRRNTALA